MSIKAHPVKRDGTSQPERFLASLDPLSIPVDERSITDIMQFAGEYAKQLKYFESDNTYHGNKWDDFFNIQKIFGTKDYSAIEKDILSRDDYQPHYALFLAFLFMFKYAQNELNQLTKKHLDFYYHKVLGLDFQSATPDKVHAIFELAKGTSTFELKNNTALDGGKDASGKKLIYKTTQTAVINTASVLNFRGVGSKNNVLRYAPVANSSDGIGGKLDTSNPKWKAFGNDLWPQAQIGFALASPVLLLNEGERTISINIVLQDPDHTISAEQDFIKAFEIYASGEKSWLGPFNTNTATFSKIDSQTFNCQILFKISKDEKSIVGFDAAKLSGSYITTEPVLQFKVPANSTSLYAILRNAAVVSTSISVTVNDITTLDLSNDQGKLNAKKPFYPFGTQPVKGSSFYVNYDELLNKNITEFSFQVTWLDPPENFKTQYQNYGSGISVTNSTFGADIYIKGENTGNTTQLFDPSNAQSTVIWPNYNKGFTLEIFPVISIGYTYQSFFTSEMSYYQNPNVTFQPVIMQMPVNIGLFGKVKAVIENVPTSDLFRFELNNSFFHKEYPNSLAVALATNPTDLSKQPKPPYTPQIKNISLNYTATAQTTTLVNNGSTTSDQLFSDYNAKAIQFFHIGVFGQSEEHPYLKSKLSFQFDQTIYLLPQYQNEGEFYFAISNISTLQSVKILFQLAEGSEDPELSARTIAWSILSSNEWQELNDAYILADSTNHLLNSGIVEILIPSTATTTNTKFESGTYWIRAAIQDQVTAVCDFVELIPQALIAEFEDQQNDTQHLASSLASGSVSKLLVKVNEIKKVSQPYASFGGIMNETETDFYTRISERLRHKQRAVTIWDYEHLILQKFPSIYKVKCLSHAATSKENSCCENNIPGKVSIVLIPDLRNQNAVNPLEPKVSLSTITKVQDYINSLNSFFISAEAQNPEYEQIELSFSVSFKFKDDFNNYKNKLNEDIRRFLSPWAYGGNEIHFGGKIHKSVLIDYIDGLDTYVDFVTDFIMRKKVNGNYTSPDLDYAEASNERAILVSAPVHFIQPFNPELPAT